jgi:Heparinase II/III-like protein/Heparinase II/III N-terminus
MTAPTRAAAYADAVRSLTARQLVHRPRRLLRPRLIALGIDDSDPPGWRPLARGAGVTQAPQSGPTPPPHLEQAFRAVGFERSVDAPDLWSSTGADDLLFSFTVHAFDELPLYLEGGRDPEGDNFWSTVMRDWLRRCGAPSLPGWHPYPLSRRIVAWCAALSAGGWEADLERVLLRSLTRQVRYLRRCVEHDIGGNHVLENAVALTIGGACLGLPGALQHGRRLLERELRDQILPDGGHLERSPSYHRRTLERLTDAHRVVERAGTDLPTLGSTCDAMDCWLSAIAGPDGGVPRLNDGWDGPPVTGSTEPVIELQESGYVVLRAGGDQALLDVGPLCPPHLPPHAHADALSFVLWADGAPVVVDPGSGSYRGSTRAWARATRTHNTVEVDGVDQCVFLGDFRAARLPRVTYQVREAAEDRVVVVASHDGYSRLADAVTHRRTFCWLPGDGLIIVDALIGAGGHETRSSLHLAAGMRAGPLAIRALGDAQVETSSGRIAPYLGQFEDAPVLEQRSSTSDRRVQGWSLLRSEAQVRFDSDRVTVRRADRQDVVFSLGAA